MKKMRSRIWSFFKNYIVLILLIFSSLILIFLCKTSSFFPEVVKGIFILFTAVITAMYAIHKYQTEQRTLRLQKLYFEDTLLGQAKSMEGMISQTRKNMLLVENLYNLIIQILNQQKVEIDAKKKELTSFFDTIATQIKLDIFSTDFKKETISKLLHDSGINKNALPTWIDKCEQDTYRFSGLLQSQILLLRIQVNRLTESNQENYLECIHDILGDHIRQNYFLIERHSILFSLLSDLVLEFSSNNYTSLEEITRAFRKKRILKIVGLLNTGFKDLILDFESIFMGEMEKENAIRLEERIKCVREKMRNTLS